MTVQQYRTANGQDDITCFYHCGYCLSEVGCIYKYTVPTERQSRITAAAAANIRIRCGINTGYVVLVAFPTADSWLLLKSAHVASVWKR